MGKRDYHHRGQLEANYQSPKNRLIANEKGDLNNSVELIALPLDYDRRARRFFRALVQYRSHLIAA